MGLRSKWAAVGAAGLVVGALAWRLTPRQAAPEAGQSRSPGFRDVTAERGIAFRMNYLPGEQGEAFKVNLYDHGCGVAVADYDGDGNEDVLLLNQLGENALFHNLGGGRFANVTAENPAVALSDRICVGASFADYDNDGDQDLFITSTRGGNVLLENRAGRFHDITQSAGVASIAHSQTGAFFDVDNDGDLDLLITNTAKWTSDEYDPRRKYYVGPVTLWDNIGRSEDFERNQLFRNNADGTFTEITDDARLAGNGWSGDLAIFDYDEDGDIDVFITNMFGMSQLYANDGQGHFTDVTRETLRRTSYGAIGSAVFDFDGDGRLDLFVGDMHSDMWMGHEDSGLVQPTRKYRYFLGRRPEYDLVARRDEKKFIEGLRIDYDVVLFGNTLYHNEGHGTFTEVSDRAHLETLWPWGATAGDFDNDGHEDLFLPSGMGYPFFYHPSSLMMNGGDGAFTDRAANEGIEPPAGGRFLEQRIAGRQAARSSRCAVAADFDGDGRLDLMVNNFNDSPYYLLNQFPLRNFVRFRLIGTRSNRDAIGAVVRLYVGERVLVRQVPGAGGYLSQPSKILHFGLGDGERIDRVEIRWPSGHVQTRPVDRLNTVYTVVEADG